MRVVWKLCAILGNNHHVTAPVISVLIFSFDFIPVLGLSLPDEWISEIEDVWKKVVAVVNASHHFDSLEAQFFPFAEDVTGFHTVEGQKRFLKRIVCVI